jgi:hypothetical protein
LGGLDGDDVRQTLAEAGGTSVTSKRLEGGPGHRAGRNGVLLSPDELIVFILILWDNQQGVSVQ